jgi:hypothetical protein
MEDKKEKIKNEDDKPDKKNKSDEILRKLEKLAKLRMMLRDPRVNVEDIDEEELDALLSRAEIMEEAIKNYMYQFGLSLYQNKQGKNYFKKFITYDDSRNFSELDSHNFEIKDYEPSFLEKLFEYTPQDRVDLKSTIENAVFDLYERDNAMVDVFDRIIKEETERSNHIFRDIEASKNARETADKPLEEVVQQEKSGKLKEIETVKANVEQDDISIEDMEIDILPASEDSELSAAVLDNENESDEWQKIYESGSKGNKDKVKIPKVEKIRRVRNPEPIIPQKDNINNR